MANPLDDILTVFYPPIEPYSTGFLEVSPVHKIYYEESGNKDGNPVIFLHGGPGDPCIGRDKDRRFFDPVAYRIIRFDQRGCGKSLPFGCLEDNDTWAVIGDIEKLRDHLGIQKWVVFGGSWGSTLVLLYAELHIHHVKALVVHSIFTARPHEISWIDDEGGASLLFPDFWEQFITPISPEERSNISAAYLKRITGNNKTESDRCVKAFNKWEMILMRPTINYEALAAVDALEEEELEGMRKLLTLYLHYTVNDFFLKKNPTQILDNAGVIKGAGIPVTIVHGRYDVLTPATTAWELYKKIPNAEMVFVDDGGHSSKSSKEMLKAVVAACDKYKNL